VNNTSKELVRVRTNQEELAKVVNTLAPQVTENSKLKMMLIGAIISLGVSTLFVATKEAPKDADITHAISKNTQQMEELLTKLNDK